VVADGHERAAPVTYTFASPAYSPAVRRPLASIRPDLADAYVP
jgi:hypothetical protein